MATMVRANISRKNKYWISKHRHYELKHFCLQYPTWKYEYEFLNIPTISTSVLDGLPSGSSISDPTANSVVNKISYAERIQLIEDTVMKTDKYLYEYLLRAVTEGLSYTYLKTRLKMPCGRDYYYEKYRKFFWLLSEARK